MQIREYINGAGQKRRMMWCTPCARIYFETFADGRWTAASDGLTIDPIRYEMLTELQAIMQDVSKAC